MMSAPGLLLAAMIASRSEQSASQTPSLESVVLVTTNVVASAKGASDSKRAQSSRSREERFPRTRDLFIPTSTEIRKRNGGVQPELADDSTARANDVQKSP